MNGLRKQIFVVNPNTPFCFDNNYYDKFEKIVILSDERLILDKETVTII